MTVTHHSNTPLTLSVTSGLLTLSVHDSLQFDGVEVALNPDLFSSISDKKGVNVNVGNNISHSRQHSRENLSFTQQLHSRDASYSSGILNSGYSNNVPDTPTSSLQEDVNTYMRENTMSNTGGGGYTPYSTPSSRNGIRNDPNNSQGLNTTNLKPGDLIEIKVWEQNMNSHGHIEIGGGEGGGGANNHPAIVIDRAASKLQQHINQATTSPIRFDQ